MTEKDIYKGIKAFLAKYAGIDAANIIRGNNNRGPMPKRPFAVMTIIDEVGRSTTYSTYDADNDAMGLIRGVQVRVQIDFYGLEDAYTAASRTAVILRSIPGCDFLKIYGISPLYPSDPRQLTVVDGENQYMERWMVEFNIDFESETSVDQDYFNTVSLEKIENIEVKKYVYPGE